jgi:hypothetical protein
LHPVHTTTLIWHSEASADSSKAYQIWK